MSPKKKASPKPKNSKESKPIPSEISRSESSPPEPDESSPPEPTEPIEIDEFYATKTLMAMTLEAWKTDVLKNLFYRINRTFCHYRLDEKYGTHIIFEQLEQLNHGRHEELLLAMHSFSETVMEELNQYLADKESTK